MTVTIRKIEARDEPRWRELWAGYCRFYEREMTAYCVARGIEYIYEECPFAEGSQSIYYKEFLNQLETARPWADRRPPVHVMRGKLGVAKRREKRAHLGH